MASQVPKTVIFDRNITVFCTFEAILVETNVKLS